MLHGILTTILPELVKFVQVQVVKSFTVFPMCLGVCVVAKSRDIVKFGTVITVEYGVVLRFQVVQIRDAVRWQGWVERGNRARLIFRRLKPIEGEDRVWDSCSES